MRPSEKNTYRAIHLLYEDAYIACFHKPAGLLTQPTSLQEASLESYVNKTYGPWYVLHRLDKDVSGICMFAKTKAACRRFEALLQQKGITRQYLAEVEGRVVETGSIQHYHKKIEFRAVISTTPKEGMKEARLLLHVVEKRAHTSIVLVELITGRYHQIRAQLSALGHPIVGDRKYKSRGYGVKQPIHLHNYTVAFFHPFLQKKLSIEDPCMFYETEKA